MIICGRLYGGQLYDILARTIYPHLKLIGKNDFDVHSKTDNKSVVIVHHFFLATVSYYDVSHSGIEENISSVNSSINPLALRRFRNPGRSRKPKHFAEVKISVIVVKSVFHIPYLLE